MDYLDKDKNFKDRFLNLFSKYIKNLKEEHLLEISELSVEMVHSSVPPEEIAELFNDSIHKVSEDSPDIKLIDIKDAISPPLIEMLMGYGLAFRHQNELRQSFEKTKLASDVIEASNEGIWITDEDKIVKIINPAFTYITSYNIDDVYGKQICDILYKSEYDRNNFKVKYGEKLRRHGWVKDEVVVYKKDGKSLPVILTMHVIRDGHGNITNYVGALEDITELKQREREKILSQKRAQDIYNLVIETTLPMVTGISINLQCIPTEDVGGDTFEFIKVDEYKSILFIADISGHGTPAAMTANIIKMLFKEFSTQSSRPYKIMTLLNNTVHKNLLPDDHVTVFCGLIDTWSMKLSYTLAGLPFPFIVREKECISLKPTNMAIGVFGEMEYSETEIDISHGDMLFTFTDGIIEVFNDKNELYGKDGMKKAALAQNTSSIHHICQNIIEDVKKHSDSDVFDDDVMLSCVKIYDIKKESDFSFYSNFNVPYKSSFVFRTKDIIVDEAISIVMEKIKFTVKIGESDLMSLQMGLFEMITNAIEHGNLLITRYKKDVDFYDTPEYWELFKSRKVSPEHGSKCVRIEFSYKEGELLLSVEDEGSGFGMENLFTASFNDVEKNSGRGILLTKMATDAVIYNDRGNKVTISKFL